MIVLVGTLGAAYLASQFLRNSIGVIAPDLAAEIGLSAAQIGVLASGFFLAFALAQLPLGVGIDRYGPKRCMLVCAAIAVVGIVLFALATTAAGLVTARILMGLGTSCYLMAPLALYARTFPAGRFALLAGTQLGIGTIGTLLATAPLAYVAAEIGWRHAFLAAAAAMVGVGLLLAALVKDAPGAGAHAETLRENLAGVAEALRTPSVARLFVLQMASYSSFVLIVGLWGGPYLTHVYGYGLTERGNVLLLPVIAQMVGALAWGASDRLGSYRLPNLVGALSSCTLLALLASVGRPAPMLLMAWLVLFGFCTAYTPLLIAHGKSLFPPRLVGRGMTLLNVGSMAGVFVSQTLTGMAIDLFPAEAGVYPVAAYRVAFAIQAAYLAGAALVYLRARDPLREMRTASQITYSRARFGDS